MTATIGESAPVRKRFCADGGALLSPADQANAAHHSVRVGVGNTDNLAGQDISAAHTSRASEATTSSGNRAADPQKVPAAGAHTSEPSAQMPDDSHINVGGGSELAHHYGFLRFLAEIVDDLEGTRIANENRLRTLTCDATDKDGEIRGLAMPDDDPQVEQLRALVDGLAALEKQAVKNLEKAMRKHPLGKWVKAQPGIGDKQGARLIAAIGDPTWNGLHDRPRTLSELRSYCGLRGGTPTTRQRGQRSNWSTPARMRLYLVAEKCMMQKGSGSIYRQTYDDAKAKYAGAVHATECKRCGPAGKPAAAGSPLSKAHIHARGIRAVMVTILRELWTHANELPGGHGCRDVTASHFTHVGAA